MLVPQALQHGEGLLARSMIGWNETVISGTVACSSSGDDLGLVMSAMKPRALEVARGSASVVATRA